MAGVGSWVSLGLRLSQNEGFAKFLWHGTNGLFQGFIR